MSPVEVVSRLALGLEPVDPMRRSRIARPVEVAVDGVPHPPPRTRRPPGAGPFDTPDVLRRIDRRNSCRYAVVYREGLAGPMDLRILDRGERYVPRRLRIVLPAPASDGRVCRPALFPGAAYDLQAGALGARGRVLRDGEPMRWTRVVATRIGDGLVVGRAHGDAHGEFLLLLQPATAVGTELPRPLRVRIAVFGPDTPPDPAAFPAAEADPLWDLPLEEATPDAAGEEVLAGERLPPGYREGAAREVVVGLEALGRERFDFS